MILKKTLEFKVQTSNTSECQGLPRDPSLGCKEKILCMKNKTTITGKTHSTKRVSVSKHMKTQGPQLVGTYLASQLDLTWAKR